MPGLRRQPSPFGLRRLVHIAMRAIRMRGSAAPAPKLIGWVRDELKSAYRWKHAPWTGEERRRLPHGRRVEDRKVWPAVIVWYETDMMIGWRADFSQPPKYREHCEYTCQCQFPLPEGTCGEWIEKGDPIMWIPNVGSAETRHFTEEQLIEAGKQVYVPGELL